MFTIQINTSCTMSDNKDVLEEKIISKDKNQRKPTFLGLLFNIFSLIFLSYQQQIFIYIITVNLCIFKMM